METSSNWYMESQVELSTRTSHSAFILIEIGHSTRTSHLAFILIDTEHTFQLMIYFWLLRKLSVIQASYPATTPSPTRVSYHDAIPHTRILLMFFSPSSLQSRRGSTTHTEQPGGLLLHQLQRLHAGTRPVARGKPDLYFPLPPCRSRLTCSWRHSQTLLYFPLPPFRGRLTCSWRHYSQPLLSPLSDV